MEAQTWDAVFIRASRRRLHPVITDVAAWGRWWPGLTVAADGAGLQLGLRAPGSRRTRRWHAAHGKQRHDLGIELRYTGEVAGTAELYYLDEPAGTVVHYLFRGRVADRGARAAVRDHRAGVRAGLHALKDRFETGRVPGAEPDPALLVEQREAIAASAARVATARQQQAAARVDAS